MRSICVSIIFVDNWINVSAKTFLLPCCTFQWKTKEIFKQIPTEIPTPNIKDFKKKRLTILTYIGVDWYLNSLRNPKPPINNQRLSNKQEEE